MTESHAKQAGVRPVWIAVAIAILGVLAMLIVDHGPWSRAHVQTVQLASHQTTGEAARSAGAAVEPTAPRPGLEPESPGPAQPADPDTR